MIARRTFAPRARRRGFTLLELIIATAVGAVVLVVIQTTFFSALRLHNTTHARLAEDQSVQRAAGIIRRDLAGLVLPGGHRARGMCPYLENPDLQGAVAAFFDAGKPVGAICHGVVLAARSISSPSSSAGEKGRVDANNAS